MFRHRISFSVDSDLSRSGFADLRRLVLLYEYLFYIDEKLINFSKSTSVLRIISIIVFVEHEKNANWYFPPVIAWSCAEISAAIIALSLPALRAIFGSLNENCLKRDLSYSTGSGGIGLDSVR